MAISFFFRWSLQLFLIHSLSNEDVIVIIICFLTPLILFFIVNPPFLRKNIVKMDLVKVRILTFRSLSIVSLRKKSKLSVKDFFNFVKTKQLWIISNLGEGLDYLVGKILFFVGFSILSIMMEMDSLLVEIILTISVLFSREINYKKLVLDG